MPLVALKIPLNTQIKTSRYMTATEREMRITLREPGVLPPFLFVNKEKAQPYYIVVEEEGELRLATFNQSGLKAWVRNSPDYTMIDVGDGKKMLSKDGVTAANIRELALEPYWCRTTVTVVNKFPKSVEVK